MTKTKEYVLSGEIVNEIRTLPSNNIYNYILASIEKKYKDGEISLDNLISLSVKMVFDYLKDRHQKKESTKDKIIVVDSIMGTGKSSYMINYINNHPDKKFICIVPTLEEMQRYIKAIKADVYEPRTMPTKTIGLQHLIKEGKNIVATHALISRIDSETINLLQQHKYTLIIGECLDVVHPYNDNFNKKDLKLLFDADYIKVDDDGFIHWKENVQDHDGRYNNVKNLCNLYSLMVLKKKNGEWSNRVIIWCLPTSFFSLFDKCYICTYLFDGSMQNAYFKLNNIKYTHMTLINGVLVPHNTKQEVEQRKSKFNLMSFIPSFKGDADLFGKNPFTKTWYINQKKSDKGKKILKKIKDNVTN